MPSKIVGVIILALVVILGVAILLPIIFGYAAYLQSSTTSIETKTITVTYTVPSYTKTVTVIYNVGNVSNDASIIFQLASPSVVQVTVYDKNYRQLSLGSGFIYDNEGHVITNEHVVEGGTYFIIMTYDNGMFEAKLIGKDSYADLAVLKAELPEKYPPLKLAGTIKIGEPVYAIGSPFGLTGSITSGIVSQVNRTGITYVPMLQTDAAINPGNSGGPLINSRGEVVGVATAGIEKSVAEGVGFAVPSTIVKRIVPELIAKGVYKHPYIGIYGEYLDPIIASSYGLPKDITSGFIITQIVRNAPAEKSGLKTKDVIIAIDNYPIKKDPDLNYIMAYKYSPGDTVVITVIRDGKIVNISLTLAERP